MVLGSIALLVLVSIWLWQRATIASAIQPIAMLTTPDIHALVWRPTDANTVFFGHHGGVLRSSDGGRTWQPTTLANADAMMLTTSPADPQRMYAAGHGIFRRSDDGGATWRAPNTAIQGADIHGFAQSPLDADRLYAMVVGQGLLTSADGGQRWTVTNIAQASHIALAVQADGTLVRGTATGIEQSADHGATWRASGQNLPNGATVLALAANDDALFAATEQGLYRRDVTSATWAATNLSGRILTVAANPTQPQTVLAVDDQGGVYRSADGGVTWGTETH